MYYILYEGLQIESNEPVYCTLYIILYRAHTTLYIKLRIIISRISFQQLQISDFNPMYKERFTFYPKVDELAARKLILKVINTYIYIYIYNLRYTYR